MLSIALYVGMCCHTVAPHLIKPGMSRAQVETILGAQGTFFDSGPVATDVGRRRERRQGTFIHTGPVTAGYFVSYAGRAFVFYGENGVELVDRK